MRAAGLRNYIVLVFVGQRQPEIASFHLCYGLPLVLGYAAPGAQHRGFVSPILGSWDISHLLPLHPSGRHPAPELIVFPAGVPWHAFGPGRA